MPPETQKRYYDKLRDLGFTDLEKDDPSFLPDITSKSSKNSAASPVPPLWSEDSTKWPSIEFGAIYVYLIDSPGPFTRDSMRAYKSLNAYEYFVDGWVQTYYERKSETGFSIVKAKVNRSQAVTEKPHEAWVAFRIRDGSVECGHCSCMAG